MLDDVSLTLVLQTLDTITLRRPVRTDPRAECVERTSDRGAASTATPPGARCPPLSSLALQL